MAVSMRTWSLPLLAAEWATVSQPSSWAARTNSWATTAGLINGIRLQHRHSVFVKEFLAPIEHLRRRRAQLQSQLAQRFKIDFLPQVNQQRDHLAAALVHQPVQR
jgi:predicted oxidoreductase (fatty acid repression mutant protein)